jgi:hypothetical protein
MDHLELLNDLVTSKMNLSACLLVDCIARAVSRIFLLGEPKARAQPESLRRAPKVRSRVRGSATSLLIKLTRVWKI